MNPTKLGKLTAKQAAQFTFGNQDPFGGEGENMFGGSPQMQPFDYRSMPGSPAQAMAQGGQNDDTSDYSYGSAGAPSGWGMGLSLAGAAMAPAAAPYAVPINAGIQAIQYARGNAPSWQQVQKARDSYRPDGDKDSYLGAADKLIRGGFAYAGRPLDGARVIAHEADQGFAKDPTYQWMKQKATGAGGYVGGAYNAARTGVTTAYNQVANTPMNQAFKAPQAAPPAPKIGAPPKPISAAPKPLAPAAPKPVQSSMPGTSPSRAI